MVVSHTLDGQRVPAEPLWWTKVTPQFRMTVKLLSEAFWADTSPSEIIRRHYEAEDNPPVDLISQRFLGVR